MHSSRSIAADAIFSHSSKPPAQEAPRPQFIMGELLMRLGEHFLGYLFLFLGTFVAAPAGFAQIGNSSNVTGTVTDPSGAVVAGATVTIHDPVSQYERSTTTDTSGSFSFPNVPFNPYHLSVTAKGFGPYAQDVDVRSTVPVSVKISLTVAGSSSSVTVEGGGRPARKRAHLSYRRGPRPVRQASSREPIVVTEFACHPHDSRHSRRLEWPVPRTWRPCGELVFC